MINQEDSDDIKGIAFSWTSSLETVNTTTAASGSLGIVMDSGASLPALSFRFAETLDIIDDSNTFNMDVGRLSVASYRNSSGVLAFASNDEARITHDDVDTFPMGLMVERGSNNYIRYSTYPTRGNNWVIDGAPYGWVITNGTTTDCTGPDNDSNFFDVPGGFIADAILPVSTSTYTTLMMSSASTVAEECTLSVFLTSFTNENLEYTIDGGTNWISYGEVGAGSYGVTGWFRTSLGQVPAGSFRVGFRWMPSSIDAHVGIYGVQLEPGYVMTSYIRSGINNSLATSRAAESIFLDVSSLAISMNSITFLVEGYNKGDNLGGGTGYPGLIGFDDYNYVFKFAVADYGGDMEILAEGDNTLGTFIPNNSYNGFSVAYSANTYDTVFVAANAVASYTDFSSSFSGSATGNLTYIQNIDFAMNPSSVILRKIQVFRGASSLPTLQLLVSTF